MRDAVWIALLQADYEKAAARSPKRKAKALGPAAEMVDPLVTEEAEFQAWVAAWHDGGHPTPLGFAARYTARKAALYLKRGDTPAGIRLELWSRAVQVAKGLDPLVKVMFLNTIRERLEEVLGPEPSPAENQR